MAILKALTDNKGVVTNYHRIGVYAPSYVDGKLYINLFGYTDESFRTAEKANKELDLHVSNFAVTLDLAENDAYSRESLYASIMEMPEFEGSTIV